MKDIISRLTKQFEEPGDFFGGIDEELICKYEQHLNCRFPESYRWFLHQYGGGGVLGIDITGGKSLETSTLISNTKSYRTMGMPEEYVVIYDLDEYVYCLDTGNLIEGECPVLSWDFVSKRPYVKYNNFYEFFLDRLEIAIEDYED
ncbi:SMI1/KNR4 family protein [Bacillus sp. DX4.1]|uniref:SMI1/KNR4 family protein n=1 Tax=Bacillus sp. DX4.1 TaxID=3055867 RepID=UPI0025A1E34A|nr:SMI1/KNR4 family protein [Bacillus sp. DX4.1]MDM5186114.1 SMI1/KNR4 family protein [Bacillus sp. DX4.1]